MFMQFEIVLSVLDTGQMLENSLGLECSSSPKANPIFA
uniref:Uncharacterized protein n=1 Tax=Rhizophora mucronata TaxID=61149 RepID=A0A2P2LSU0_RHIMU